MKSLCSAEELARAVNEWSEKHQIAPANGQAGERITERGIRYYRTLGLVDAPASAGAGFGEKHRLQLIAIRLLQAQGIPLNRIRHLLFGRSLDDLKRIEREGLKEVQTAQPAVFGFTHSEAWTVTTLDDEFLLVSRKGRRISAEQRKRVLAALITSHPRLTAANRHSRKE
jgi:DNA-binding transcriptional MerR regulator